MLVLLKMFPLIHYNKYQHNMHIYVSA